MDTNDRGHIAHLLTRAAFVATPAAIAHGMEIGSHALVEELVGAPHAEPPPEPARERVDPEIRYSPEAVTAWFSRALVNSPTPAIERMMWFWHGHFATSVGKVEFPSLMFRHFVMLRRNALGDFAELLRAVTIDPAMMLWLDLHLNAVDNLNENYARELLELFTLGVDAGYDQRDVVEVARALTGWELGYDDDEERPTGAHLVGQARDTGSKSVLGSVDDHDLDSIVALLADHPACHRFVVRRLWHRFAGTEIPAHVEGEIAEIFSADRSIAAAVQALLTHPEFFDTSVRGGLVMSPYESLVRAYRGFGILVGSGSGEELDVIVWLAELMGQVPGWPPNVAGWPHNRSWLDAAHAAGRVQAAREFAELVMDSDSVAAERIRLARSTSARREALADAFGVAAWSPATAGAIDAASDLPDPHDAAGAAITVAFCSPEVTLS